MKYIACLVFTLMFSVVACGQDYVVVFLNNNPEKEELPEEEVQALQSKHLENIGKLAKEGKLLVAGPFEGGGGIFILNTTDTDEAKVWLLSDPAIRANRWKIEIFGFDSRVGIPCLASTDASMVEKQFIRYNPHITKFNVQQAPQLFLEHDNYLKKLTVESEVLIEGIFDNNDGGMLIFDSPVDPDIINADPAVVEGIIIPEIKTIWIADGSFCHG